MFFTADRYWIKNAHVPSALLVHSQGRMKGWGHQAGEDLLLVDLEIWAGEIVSMVTAGTFSTYHDPSVDLQGGMVFPCFVDLHTHLDKAHIWERSANSDGTFNQAIVAIQADNPRWTAEDLYRRMEFGLKCSYAHGTQAIRTHLDSLGDHAADSWAVFDQLRQDWRDRITLQAVSLVPLEHFLTPDGEKLADHVAEMGGILGGVGYVGPDVAAQVERVFALAQERQLHLDFHVDETDNPKSNVLQVVAEATVRHDYQGKVVCGHCCSLAVQPLKVAKQTIAQVKQAQIGIVSLPLCNLYLQDRKSKRTPRWRGVTLLHELKQAGVEVALANDNCRDPFYAYGDHDGLEVLAMSTKIAHLDRPYKDWCRAVTTTPANLMGLTNMGRIGVGLSADLVLFRARRYSELFSRSQHDRIVLRAGREIDTTLPDYAELDDLLTV